VLSQQQQTLHYCNQVKMHRMRAANGIQDLHGR